LFIIRLFNFCVDFKVETQFGTAKGVSVYKIDDKTF
jgi:hypothetical protein